MDRTFTQNIVGDRNNEIKEAFETVGIIIRAKIEKLCNEEKFDEAKKLEEALILINNTDYNH